MDVAITELRAHLSHWLELAREGDEIVVTDRGVPIARLLGLDTTATLERLTADRVIAKPAQAGRPSAAGRRRPQPKRSVAALLIEQRG